MSSETGPPFGSLSSAQPTTLDHSPTASDRQLYPNSTEKGPASTSAAEPKATRSSNWKKYAVIGVVALIIVVLAVVLPVYFLVIKKNSSSSGGSSGGGGGGGSGSDGEGVVSQPGGVTSGTDGSVVFTETGNFTYVNKFGGRWSYDPANPYANDAKAQSYTPALSEPWKWGQDIVRGVNLGGWLVTEPFIVPALYQKYSGMTYENGSFKIIDEWHLVEQMKADGSIGELENHYNTFITEEDFAQIAGAGLNWVRLPIPFWAIETVGNEPYLQGAQWKYVLKAIGWARKYGIRINLDLHTHPGSQNGWNHSGLSGGALGVNWLNGVMGIANAQRSLDYIRIITEFISQPEYQPIVPFFGIVNEPRIMEGTHVLDPQAVQNFYYEAYNVVRNVTGIGEGKGPMISFHDGFLDFTTWNTFMTGADRIAMDTHPYFAFDGPNVAPLAEFLPRPCSRWGANINTTQNTFGVITAGEWSVAVNDCGLFVTGVGSPVAYGGDCTQWTHYENWDQATKDNLKTFALATMDALQNWFFWAWKIAPSAEDNMVRAPFWSYKLGMEQGWLPTDPREAAGACAALGQAPSVPFAGTMQPWQTGGVGAGTMLPAATATFAWPPTSLNSNFPVGQYLPTYTPTGTHTTLAVPAVTGNVDAGDGWFNNQDQAAMFVPVNGCTYPDAYGGALLPQPVVPFCSNTEVFAVPTPVPVLTTDANGLPITTTLLETDPNAVPVPTSTSAPVRRFAPRAGLPVATMMA